MNTAAQNFDDSGTTVFGFIHSIQHGKAQAISKEPNL